MLLTVELYEGHRKNYKYKLKLQFYLKGVTYRFHTWILPRVEGYSSIPRDTGSPHRGPKTHTCRLQKYVSNIHANNECNLSIMMFLWSINPYITTFSLNWLSLKHDVIMHKNYLLDWIIMYFWYTALSRERKSTLINNMIKWLTN